MITIEEQKPYQVAVNQPVETVVFPSVRERALWMAFRQALLMIVDAIEVYIGTEIRTAELRKRSR